MALFRRLFYKKPPDRLLELSERVYVFDCSFSTDIMNEDEYRIYLHGIVAQLQDHYPDAAFMVFNFKDGEKRSQISDVLSQYDMTVMEYPRQYDGCPLLPLEMIHHFLRSSESWLSLQGQQNVLLMHCERGGWPVLAFMLAGLLLYRKQYAGEQKTLEMVYKQAPRELIHLLSSLNSLPSQLRYLQYISRRKLGTDWPPPFTLLSLDCIILKFLPLYNHGSKCRPVIRVYGQDPSSKTSERRSKPLFSSSKMKKNTGLYRREECDVVKIDIHCIVQGDIVLECILSDNDLAKEETMFRVMFNTLFIRSNVLMLTRDEVDTLWDAKDQFSKEFRAEVHFSYAGTLPLVSTKTVNEGNEMESTSPEEFFEAEEILSSVVDGQDAKVVLDYLSVKPNAQDNQSQVATDKNKLDLDSALDEVDDLICHAKSKSLNSGTNYDSEQDRNSVEVFHSLKKMENEDSEMNLADSNIKQKSDKGLPVIAKKLPVSTSKFLAEAVGASKKSNQQDSQVSSTRHAKPNVASRWIPSNKGSYTNSMHVYYPPSSRHIPAPSDSTTAGKDSPPRGKDKLHSGAAPESSVVGDKNYGSSRGKQSAYQLSKELSPSRKNFSVTLHSACSEELESPKLCPTIQIPPPPPPPPPPQPQERNILPSVSSQTRQSMHADFTLAPSQPPTSFTSNVTSRSKSPPPPPLLPILSQNAVDSPSLSVTPLFSTPTPLKDTRYACFSPPPPHPPKDSITQNMNKLLPPPPPPLTCVLSKHTCNTITIPPRPPPPPPHIQPVLSPLICNPPSPPPPPLRGVQPPPYLLHVPSAPPPPPPPPFMGPPTLKASGPTTAPMPSVETSTQMIGCPRSPPHLSTMGAPTPATSGPPPPPPPPLRTMGIPTPMACGRPPPPPPPPLQAMGVSTPMASGHPPPPPPLPTVVAPIPMVGGPKPPPPPTRGTPPPPPLLGANVFGPPVPPGPPRVPGSIPPPPPSFSENVPGAGGKGSTIGRGRGLSRSSGFSATTARRSTLKPLHWSKVTRVLQGSLWEEFQRHGGESPISTEFDVLELETLFSALIPKSDNSGGQTGGRRKSLGSKPDRVHLIDLRRANNTEIMLTKVKMPLPDMMASALAMDESILDADQVENLIKFCPTKEEMELLKGYMGDKENLGKCEQFFLELMKVPRVESKLRVFLFKIQFTSQVSDFTKNLSTVNSACEEVRKSIKLKEIMKKILYLGNTLNQGTARGSAIGFKLDSLLKLAETRASNNKMTLMHYLCKVLASKFPSLLNFHEDLVSLEAASKIQLKALAEEMQAIIKGLEKVKLELEASANDGPVSETFQKTLKEFIDVAEIEVGSVTNLYAAAGRNADALALYFGEDPTRCPFEQVPATLLNFVRLFRRAHEENCKRDELEKKKAKKEAEMQNPKGMSLTKKGVND